MAMKKNENFSWVSVRFLPFHKIIVIVIAVTAVAIIIHFYDSQSLMDVCKLLLNDHDDDNG